MALLVVGISIVCSSCRAVKPPHFLQTSLHKSFLSIEPPSLFAPEDSFRIFRDARCVLIVAHLHVVVDNIDSDLAPTDAGVGLAAPSFQKPLELVLSDGICEDAVEVVPGGPEHLV